MAETLKTIYTDKHLLRDAQTELYGGKMVQPFERPSRLRYIHDRITDTKLGPIVEPTDFGMGPILRVHDAGYVAFLQRVWDDWTAQGYEGEAIASNWPAKRMSTRIPDHVEGKLGYYALAAETTITKGTWDASYASAQVALTGAEMIHQGARTAFSLCRPPGHHATGDMFGGYCFLNNAGIAAQHLLDQGAQRVAIVDVDFHHGNGTQDIFYDRDDVLFASIHGDPMQAFPYFLGHAEEEGVGAGKGFTINKPLPPGTPFPIWRTALAEVLARVADYKPDALIISLGVDTFENDPISFFKLKSEDFTTYGADIAALNLATLFVMEGGYDIDEIGVNTVNTLRGFDAATS